MKKYFLLFALSCISYTANATEITQPKPTKLNSLSVYSTDHINNKKIILNTTNQAIIPNFSRCTVSIHQERHSATVNNNFNSCQ